MHYHLSLWPVDNAYGFASDSMRLSARPPVMNAWRNHPEWIFPEGAEQSCRTDAIVVSNTMERYLDRVLCKFEMTLGRDKDGDDVRGVSLHRGTPSRERLMEGYP